MFYRPRPLDSPTLPLNGEAAFNRDYNSIAGHFDDILRISRYVCGHPHQRS